MPMFPATLEASPGLVQPPDCACALHASVAVSLLHVLHEPDGMVW